MIHGWSALGGLTMAGWEDELERWLMPFLDRLGHKTRQRMCPLYVAGLIGPGDRHALMTMIAYAFLQHRRLAHAGRKKKNQRTSASTNHARRTSRHRRSYPSAAVSAVPILPKANP